MARVTSAQWIGDPPPYHRPWWRRGVRPYVLAALAVLALSATGTTAVLLILR